MTTLKLTPQWMTPQNYTTTPNTYSSNGNFNYNNNVNSYPSHLPLPVPSNNSNKYSIYSRHKSVNNGNNSNYTNTSHTSSRKDPYTQSYGSSNYYNTNGNNGNNGNSNINSNSGYYGSVNSMGHSYNMISQQNNQSSSTNGNRYRSYRRSPSPSHAKRYTNGGTSIPPSSASSMHSYSSSSGNYSYYTGTENKYPPTSANLYVPSSSVHAPTSNIAPTIQKPVSNGVPSLGIAPKNSSTMSTQSSAVLKPSANGSASTVPVIISKPNLSYAPTNRSARYPNGGSAHNAKNSVMEMQSSPPLGSQQTGQGPNIGKQTVMWNQKSAPFIPSQHVSLATATSTGHLQKSNSQPQPHNPPMYPPSQQNTSHSSSYPPPHTNQFSLPHSNGSNKAYALSPASSSFNPRRSPTLLKYQTSNQAPHKSYPKGSVSPRVHTLPNQQSAYMSTDYFTPSSNSNNTNNNKTYSTNNSHSDSFTLHPTSTKFRPSQLPAANGNSFNHSSDESKQYTKTNEDIQNNDNSDYNYLYIEDSRNNHSEDVRYDTNTHNNGTHHLSNNDDSNNNNNGTTSNIAFELEEARGNGSFSTETGSNESVQGLSQENGQSDIGMYLAEGHSCASNNSSYNSNASQCSNIAFSDEAEERFLKSLGWEQQDDDEEFSDWLTEDEINQMKMKLTHQKSK